MPTKLEILFEDEIDIGRLERLAKKRIIGTKPILDFSVTIVDDSGEPLPLNSADISKLSIYALPLKNRTIRVLTEAAMNDGHGRTVVRPDKNIRTVAELTRKNARELMQYFDFGAVALKDVRDALAKFGLALEGEQDSLPLT
jgi:hypothetical protein